MGSEEKAVKIENHVNESVEKFRISLLELALKHNCANVDTYLDYILYKVKSAMQSNMTIATSNEMFMLEQADLQLANP